MPCIYDQHDAAFRNVSAYVVLKDGERVGSVALKFGASGLRTTAFVHFHGTTMVKGIASGGGYDKATAAVAHAARKMAPVFPVDRGLGHASGYDAFRTALLKDAGPRWYDALRDAGFTVLQAV